MKYNISKDIQIVCTILNISQSQLAEELNVSRSTVARIVSEKTYPSAMFLDSFYSFAYKNRIRKIDLNKLKIEFNSDLYDKILFHGARNEIEGEIDLYHSRNKIDLGDGFYLGESYEQASSYIFSNRSSSVYVFDASKLDNLKVKEFSVSLDWMLLISYFRGQLEKYKESKTIIDLLKSIEGYDVIIAPIADNNMYEIINKFIRGDITDLQAIASLSASSLGKQHVLKTEKACKSVKIINRLFLSKEERADIENKRKDFTVIAEDKHKLAIETYRRQGKYIEELLKDE